LWQEFVREIERVGIHWFEGVGVEEVGGCFCLVVIVDFEEVIVVF
jgi:hypothetical protein